MKVGTDAETNEKRKKTILGIVLITIVCAIIFSNLFKLLMTFLKWLIKLVIKQYIYILIGVVVILLGRRILFRGKLK